MERAKGSHLFGKVALQLGVLTRDQVRECVEEQTEAKEKGELTSLGEIAVTRGFLDENQASRVAIVQAFLEAREADRRFGQVAVENAFVSKDQLADALQLQKKAFKEKGQAGRIGQVLVELAFITPEQRDAVLAAQRRLAGD